MLETRRITSYGKRASRIIYVSDEPRIPHDSPFTLHRSSRENTTSKSPPSTRKVLGRGRKVKGLSTSPRGSPKSGQLRGITSKKPPPTAPTPKRRPLGLKGAALPSSPSIAIHGQQCTQTPNAKVLKFAPFVDSHVIVIDDPGQAEAVQLTKRVNKGKIASSNARADAAMEDELSEIVRPPHKRATKRAVILTDEEDEEEAFPFRVPRRDARSRPIVISDSSDDYPEIVPVKSSVKTHTLRSTKPQPTLVPKGPRLPKVSSRRVQADAPLPIVRQPSQPKSGRGQVAPAVALLPPPAPKSTSQVVPVRPPSPRRSQRKGLGHSQSRARPPPPSTSDLELELATLTLADGQPSRRAPELRSRPSSEKTASTSRHFTSLLAECDQTEPYCFSTFIEAFPCDDIHGESPPTDLGFRKIGEASYSEVFAIGNVVLKIVPLRDESSVGQVDDGVDADLPHESETKDVLQEIIVTRAMGQICPGFIKLLRTYVVQGGYPSLLLSLWDEFDNTKTSDSIRPDVFPPTQAYALLVLPHGGPDLEAYTFPVKTGWRQACSIFWQTAKALATAEELVSFEHRDLHWGQILVKSSSPTRKVVPRTPRRRVGEAAVGMVGVPMDHPSHGVTATIIDLGLARMNAGDGSVHWTLFDDLIFEGEGDYQFDVYRLMQRHHGDTWDQYRPLTNVMWLHYLASKLLRSKRLRPPGARNATAVANEYSEKQCYDCLVELEQLSGQCIRPTKVKKSRGVGAKGIFDKAGDVVYFARARGWLE